MSPLKLLTLCLGFCLFVVTTAFAADDVTITPRAREHFNAGVAYLEDPAGAKYEEAYREFHIAFAESPTYRILTNIGLCALNLERDGEAIDAYERFLAKATPKDIPTDKRKLMERDITMLKASLVRLTIAASPTTLLLTDERLPVKGNTVTNRYEVTNGKIELGIHPGHHRITASAAGHEPQTWEFEASSATTHEHRFELEPSAEKAARTVGSDAPKPVANASADVAATPQTKEKKDLTWVYVGAAATGIFAVGATVMGFVEMNKKDDYEALNESGNNPDKASDMRDKVKRYALLTDIGIGAAVLSAGATAILYFTASSASQEPRKDARAKDIMRLRLEPSLGPTQAGLSFSGQF
jgi:tetratricopeptide (TPR) repeat protein